MAAEVGENAIDIALKVARALSAVGADYFLGGSSAAATSHSTNANFQGVERASYRLAENRS